MKRYYLQLFAIALVAAIATVVQIQFFGDGKGYSGFPSPLGSLIIIGGALGLHWKQITTLFRKN